jgi:hypothetical protein
MGSPFADTDDRPRIKGIGDGDALSVARPRQIAPSPDPGKNA